MNNLTAALPTCTHVYENHHLDSPRWDRFETRPDDIVVTTAYKSGTTWMQTIVANLIFQDGQIPGDIMDISPWVDMRLRPFEEICATTAAQTHRRILKTHLPLDGLPWRPGLKYIFVGRDLRDVFMSMWNHYRNHSEVFYGVVNNPQTLVGEPFPRCPEEIRAYWRNWATRGWFDWQSDGYPHFSASWHAQTWWDYRHLPNILFVHYADLLAQPAAEIARVAAFLEIPFTEPSLQQIVEAVSFDTMKSNAGRILGKAAVFWEGGGQTFLNRGSNGRWREVLTGDDEALYRAMVERTLSPDCARWLEQGRAALTDAARP